MLCFDFRRNYTMTCIKQILRYCKSSVTIAAYIGRKFSYLFTLFAESQQCHPLSVSYSFITQKASNSETVLICLLSLYIVPVFIGFCFYLNLYLSALSAYSASASRTHRHIYIHMCARTQIHTHTHKHTYRHTQNMGAYSRLLFRSNMCININICSAHNINQDMHKGNHQLLHEYALLALGRFIIRQAA